MKIFISSYEKLLSTHLYPQQFTNVPWIAKFINVRTFSEKDPNPQRKRFLTFFESQIARWLTRCMNLYTRSGWLVSEAREHNSLYVDRFPPEGVVIAPSSNIFVSCVTLAAVFRPSTSCCTSSCTKSFFMSSGPLSYTTAKPLDAKSWMISVQVNGNSCFS